MAKIEWMKLKRSAERITGYTIGLHGATELPAGLWAVVHAVPQEYAYIALNLQHIKTADVAIRAVAHELAHAILEDEGHGKAFEAKWQELESRLRKEYYGQ